MLWNGDNLLLRDFGLYRTITAATVMLLRGTFIVYKLLCAKNALKQNTLVQSSISAIQVTGISIQLSKTKVLTLHSCIIKASLKRCKLARRSKVPGMRALTFHANEIMKVVTRFEVQPVEPSITCMKRLCAHSRDLTRASKLASCKRGLSNDK